MKRLVLLLAAACAHSPVRGDIHERGWLLVETAHIALRTDLDRADAVAHARRLERYRDALAHVYGLVAPGAAPPRGRVSVVHLARCADLELIQAEASGLVFGSVRGENIAVTCQGQTTTLVHELAHIFNRHHFARLPVWVEEGLATYYSTLEVDGGRAVLGNFPSDLSELWNRPRYLPGLSALLRTSRDEFYQPMAKARNYFCAWKLVHLLNNTSADRRERFRRYLAALREGIAGEEAWRSAFGDSTEELASDYVHYQDRERVNRLVTRFAWSEPPPPRARRMRTVDVHLLWAELLMLEHVDAVGEQLDHAARLEPDSPTLLHLRVAAGMMAAAPPGYDGLDGSPPAALGAMAGQVRRLIERSSDPYVLDTVATYFALSKKPAAGLNFAIRSVQGAPDCARCWDTVGVLYFQAGKVDRAVEAQSRAVLLYGERAPGEVRARLRRYREALRRTPPAGSAR